MSRQLRLLPLLTVVLLGACSSPERLGPQTDSGVRPLAFTATSVLTLGDSITAGFNVPGGYRTTLYSRLSGLKNVDFVGTLQNGPATLSGGVPFDADHNGHDGYKVNEIRAVMDARVSATTTVLQQLAPDVVLLLAGTNDCADASIPVGQIAQDLSDFIDVITAQLPNATVYVAQITPAKNKFFNNRVVAYNALIPDVVANKNNPNVKLVNMYAALSPRDLADNVHPNAKGYAKIANTWYSALTAP